MRVYIEPRYQFSNEKFLMVKVGFCNYSLLG